MSDVQTAIQRKRSRTRLLLILIVTVPGIFIALRTFGPLPARVAGSALAPVLLPGDYLWTLPASRTVQRDTAVLMEPPQYTEPQSLVRVYNRVRSFVARLTRRDFEAEQLPPRWVARVVVAIPGDRVSLGADRVEVRRADGGVSVYNPPSLMHPSLHARTTEIEVPADHVIVLALQRGYFDSRHWGPVPIASLQRRVWAVLWPLSRFGTVDP